MSFARIVGRFWLYRALCATADIDFYNYLPDFSWCLSRKRRRYEPYGVTLARDCVRFQLAQ